MRSGRQKLIVAFGGRLRRGRGGLRGILLVAPDSVTNGATHRPQPATVRATCANVRLAIVSTVAARIRSLRESPHDYPPTRAPLFLHAPARCHGRVLPR